MSQKKVRTNIYVSIMLTIFKKKVDRRPWSENNNTITVDDHVVDIPPQWSSTDKYCASLAHKANCSEITKINSKYDLFYNHPRYADLLVLFFPLTIFVLD